MKSIQRELSLRIIAAVLSIAGAAGAFLYFHARSSLTEEFDRTLTAQAKLVAGMVTADEHGKVEFNASDAEMADFRRLHRPSYFQIRNADGSVFSRSPSLGDHDLPAFPGGTSIVREEVLLPDGARGRSAGMRFTPRIDADEPPREPGKGIALPAMTIVVAQDRHELDEALGVLVTSLLLAAVALAGGSAIAVALSVRRGLRPLNQLARQADSIGAGSLNQFFPTAGLPSELLPICHGLNNLLTRLGRAFARERRFTADAAHELRTPIAELRSLAEVALKWPGDASAEHNYRDALNIAVQMEGMVTALLAIARCDARSQPLHLTDLDLGQLVRDAWPPYEAMALSRGLAVQWDLAPDVIVRTDRAMFGPMIRNLFSNAVAYTPAGRRIMCRLATVADRAELTVSNDSTGLCRDDLPHLFEPFWRKDAARGGATHTGLGLALVAAYADSLGIDVKPALDDDGLFSIQISVKWIAPEGRQIVAPGAILGSLKQAATAP